MTTWLDYSANPPENNGPPPVGAPEFMPTSQVNNVMREMMSVIRLMGDEVQADLDSLGTMAAQDADAVAITGGSVTATLAGPGGGITNLRAQALIEGPIPKEIFPPDATPLDVKVARAAIADALTAAGSLALLPIGTILMWYSANPVPAGWHVCDGTAGTPNLQSKFVLGAGPANPMGDTGGAFGRTQATDAQGGHDHGGGTGGTALTVGQLPVHSHTEFALSGAGGGFQGPVFMADGTTGHNANVGTLATGNNEPHAHIIGAQGAHVHNVTVNTTPPYVAVYYIMRVS